MDTGELRRRRLALGLNQEQLAGALGVSRVSVSAWESGRTAPLVGMLDLALEALEYRYERTERQETDERQDGERGESAAPAGSAAETQSAG